jgi:hypothetical protein
MGDEEDALDDGDLHAKADGSTVSKFIVKLMAILDDASAAEYISWSPVRALLGGPLSMRTPPHARLSPSHTRICLARPTGRGLAGWRAGGLTFIVLHGGRQLGDSIVVHNQALFGRDVLPRWGDLAGGVCRAWRPAYSYHRRPATLSTATSPVLCGSSTFVRSSESVA